MSGNKRTVKKDRKRAQATKQRESGPRSQNSLQAESQTDVLLERVRQDPGLLSSAEVLHLQRTLGNQQVGQLLGPAVQGRAARLGGRTTGRPASVQRVLDEGKYKPEAIREAGMQPGFKLFGRTAFSKLLLALRQYYNSKNQTEQYVNLNKVIAQATAYEQSATRGKEHKGKKATRESNKGKLVSDLLVDAQAEVDNLKTNVDEGLMFHITGNDPSTAVMMMANRVAAAIGKSLTQMKAMSAEDLKMEYIEKVYLDYRIKSSAGLDTGEKGKLYDQLELNFSSIQADKLAPESEAKELFEKIKASQIHDPVAYRSGRAPKFERGGTADEGIQPGVPGWSAQNQINITGNDDFRTKVKGLLDVIATVKVGREMLQGLGAAAEANEDMVHGDNRTTVATISPPSISNVARLDAQSGPYMYKAAAGGASAVVDPDNPFVGSDLAQGDAEKWRIRDAAIGLFHELIHTYLHKIGGDEFAAKEDPSIKINPGSQGGLAEVRITGVPYEKEINGQTYTFPFDDPDYNYISENTFRREFAAAQGAEEVYLRPSYGNEPGQKPLGLAPVPLPKQEATE
ncbi:MAG: M91 family zinc metallopeptidase [Candidatus Promineifilaceae bacterium]|nr:M91 family zinc metallopeptidase [Candidatus Promineifilaceae bacterium]